MEFSPSCTAEGALIPLKLLSDMHWSLGLYVRTQTSEPFAPGTELFLNFFLKVKSVRLSPWKSTAGKCLKDAQRPSGRVDDCYETWRTIKGKKTYRYKYLQKGDLRVKATDKDRDKDRRWCWCAVYKNVNRRIYKSHPASCVLYPDASPECSGQNCTALTQWPWNQSLKTTEVLKKRYVPFFRWHLWRF